MTISSTTRKAGPFFGNGVATNFVFDFKLFSGTELRVILADEEGVERDLVPVTDFSVTLNADQDEGPGGNVSLLAPLATGSRLVLLSNVADTQPVDLTNQGGFYPELVNGGLDRNTVLVQQLREQMGRSITVPVTADPGDLALPSPQEGQLLGWAAGGLTNFDPSELVSVVAFGQARLDLFDGTGAQTAFALSNSPGVQNNLRVSIDGVVQVAGEDFSWAGGTALIFGEAPPAGTRIQVQYQEALVEAGSAAVDFSNVDPYVGRAALGLADVNGKIPLDLIPASPTPTDAVTSVNGRTGAVTLAKADVGLGSADNTPDASKPVSTAQQAALNLKSDKLDTFINFNAATFTPVQSTSLGAVCRGTRAGAGTVVTLPADFPAGHNFIVRQVGVGPITFVAASGATLTNRSGHSKMAGVGAEVSLSVDANVGGAAAAWFMAGDTAA